MHPKTGDFKKKKKKKKRNSQLFPTEHDFDTETNLWSLQVQREVEAELLREGVTGENFDMTVIFQI